MRNPWADEFEQTHRSLDCRRGGHDGCEHMCGLGGGFNPRRFRLEFGAALCKCECHSPCPITSSRAAVPFEAWRDSCTCTGATQARAEEAQTGDGLPDFGEYVARSRRQSEARSEAFRAARAKAAGRSRFEIRDMYVSELRSRDLKIPPEDLLDATVDAIAGDYRASARLMGRGLRDLAKLAGSVIRPHS